jgi:hypothetical protein
MQIFLVKRRKQIVVDQLENFELANITEYRRRKQIVVDQLKTMLEH